MLVESLGPYRILGKLGEGGMGEVYRARDTKLNRDVAIKFLPDVLAHDAERVARFTREAQTLASLNHPNIAQIYGIVEAPLSANARPGSAHVHALVMELVEGEDLTFVIAGRPMPLADALPIAQQIAEALEGAHEQGIVHRDLKPANIKVRHDGTVKVLDFGLAKAMGPAASGAALGVSGSRLDVSDSPTIAPSSTSLPGTIMGTVGYMSPEQAKGRTVDRRADIWAFGVVLYEMLTGRPLFEGETASEVLAAVLRQEVDWIRLPAATPPRVRDLLRRCLERDPRMRLRDIGEARLALGAGAEEPPSQPVVAPIRRRWTGRLTRYAGIGAVAFAAGFSVAALVVGRIAPAAAGAALSITQLTASGNVISAAVSPDGRYIVYVESERGMQSLWLQQVTGGQTLRLIPDQAASYWNHTFTPDGDSIVFGRKSRDDAKGGLFAISTLGGVARRLAGDIDSAPGFSPDGRRMVFLRQACPTPEESALIVANADGSNEKVLASVRLPEFVAGIFFGGPAWSPDGKTIVTALGRYGTPGGAASAKLIRVAVDTGTITTLADPGWIMAAQAQWLPDGRSLMVIARAPDQVAPQVWSVSIPGGVARRVTNDLNDHRVISLTHDGGMLVSVAGSVLTNVTIQPLKGGGRPARISRATHDGLRGVAFAPDGRLLFSSDVGNASTLWVSRADASDRSPLLRARRDEVMTYPLMASDGTVFFVAIGPKGPELRATSKDGTSTRAIASDATRDPISTSADGSVVVFAALDGGVSHVFKAGADGSGSAKLTPAPGSNPAVDPAGRRVAYYYDDSAGRARIGVASIQGGPLLADFPAEPPSNNSRLVLRDEGLYLNTMPGDLGNVWLQPLDGRPARRVTAFDDQTLFDFSVSPDGVTLALVRGVRLRDAQLITGFAGSEGP